MRRNCTPAYGLIFASLLSVSACFQRGPNSGGTSDPGAPGFVPPRGTARPTPGNSRTPRSVVAKKMVASKSPPVTLVAGDNTHCDVDEKTYKDTRIGDAVTCLWQR
jgi:hypothetical protein